MNADQAKRLGVATQFATWDELYRGWKETEWVDESDAMECADAVADSSLALIDALAARLEERRCDRCDNGKPSSDLRMTLCKAHCTVENHDYGCNDFAARDREQPSEEGAS